MIGQDKRKRKEEKPEEKDHLLLLSPMLHQGGFERVCVETARLMTGTCRVTVLIFSDKDIHYDVEGLRIVNINLPSRPGRGQKMINVLRRSLKTWAFKRREGVSHSYSFGPTANYVNVLSRAGDRVFTGIRGATDLDRIGELRLFCRLSDRVICCSREIQKRLVELCPGARTACLYNPVDVEAIQKKAEEEVEDLLGNRWKEKDLVGGDGRQLLQKTIITLGRSDVLKGYWHLLKAFFLLKKRLPHTRLLLLGQGSYERERRLAEDLGLEVGRDVFFPGVRKNPFPYVRAADLFVLSSVHEGFPNALLEAMALGKPVVAADCFTGPGEILSGREDAGVLVEDLGETSDYRAEVLTEGERRLSRAMEEVLTREDLAVRYGEGARRRAMDFSPETYREELCKILGLGRCCHEKEGASGRRGQ